MMSQSREPQSDILAPAAIGIRSGPDLARIPLHPPTGRARSVPGAAPSVVGGPVGPGAAEVSSETATLSIARTPGDGRSRSWDRGPGRLRQELSPASTGTPTAEEVEDPAPILAEPAGPAPLGVEPPAGLPGQPGACLVNAAMPYSRSGILRSSTGTVGEKFEVRAEWRSDPALGRGETSYCAAECGEYHQFVKGHMRSSANKDGSNLKDVSAKIFGGVALDENVFQEDGLDSNPKARYGHRNEPRTMDEQYDPTRATGPRYVGRDFPNVSIGTFADIDLTFLGKLVDTCNRTESVSDPWRVQYRGVIRP